MEQLFELLLLTYIYGACTLNLFRFSFILKRRKFLELLDHNFSPLKYGESDLIKIKIYLNIRKNRYGENIFVNFSIKRNPLKFYNIASYIFEGMKFFVLDTKYDKYFGLSSKARHGKKLSGFEPDRALGFELGLFFVGKTKLNQSH